ncbi:MAG TPA: hypothetical protein VGM17_15475 [Rhizomicrobium sp.]|jgi:hypothetical protein
MKPLFTVHGGEQLVGEYIEREFKNVSLWLPTRDTGIDLLVTSRDNRRNVSLQVKFSKDFQMSHIEAAMRTHALAYGWWTFDRRKLRESVADYWVLVLLPFAHRDPHFIVTRPKDLAERYDKLARNQKAIQTYLWITRSRRCIETRGLTKNTVRNYVEGTLDEPVRDFSRWLENWEPIQTLNS